MRSRTKTLKWKKAHNVKLKISYKDAKLEESYTGMKNENSHRKVKKKKSHKQVEKKLYTNVKKEKPQKMWKVRNHTKM